MRIVARNMETVDKVPTFVIAANALIIKKIKFNFRFALAYKCTNDVLNGKIKIFFNLVLIWFVNESRFNGDGKVDKVCILNLLFLLRKIRIISKLICENFFGGN